MGVEETTIVVGFVSRCTCHHRHFHRHQSCSSSLADHHLSLTPFDTTHIVEFVSIARSACVIKESTVVIAGEDHQTGPTRPCQKLSILLTFPITATIFDLLCCQNLSYPSTIRSIDEKIKTFIILLTMLIFIGNFLEETCFG